MTRSRTNGRRQRIVVVSLTGVIVAAGAALGPMAFAEDEPTGEDTARCVTRPVAYVTTADTGRRAPDPCPTTTRSMGVDQPRGGKSCVARVSSREVTCFDTYREAMALATGGRVANAPLAAADGIGDLGLEAAIDQLGAGASSKPTASTMEATVPLVTEYADPDFGGNSLTIYGTAPCADNGTSNVLDVMPDGWDNVISSYRTFNNCQAKHFADQKRKGNSASWQVGGQPYIGDDLNDQASSVELKYADIPSVAQLLTDCGKATDSCDFRPKGGRATSYTANHEVTRAYNCSTREQVQKLTWSDTTAGKNTVSSEISVTAGFDFLTKFETSFKLTYAHEWSWSKTVTNETDITVPAGEVGTISRAALLQTAGGEYELHYGSKHWGHYVWYVRDFSGTGPVPDDAGVTTWTSHQMSDAERSAQCR
jgi:hypothetical protein